MSVLINFAVPSFRCSSLHLLKTNSFILLIHYYLLLLVTSYKEGKLNNIYLWDINYNAI